MTLLPTKTVRWIKRGDQVVMQQWYQNPIVPTAAQLQALGEPWLSGEFREEITPIVSDEC